MHTVVWWKMNFIVRTRRCFPFWFMGAFQSERIDFMPTSGMESDLCLHDVWSMHCEARRGCGFLCY